MRNLSVSVCMATFNGERFLKSQLESILSQIGEADEVIVIDDCSVDGTAALLNEFSALDGRVKPVFNAQNVGVRRTFESALAHSRSDVIFLSDQDDVWLPGKYQAFMDAFNKNSKVTVVASDAQIIDAHGNITASSFIATRGGFNGSLTGTLWRNRYLGCSMAFRRSVVDLALPIPQMAPMHDMWFGILGWAIGHVVYLNEPLMQYRRHGGNVSPSHSQSLYQMALWRISLFWAFLYRSWSRGLLLKVLGIAS